VSLKGKKKVRGVGEGREKRAGGRRSKKKLLLYLQVRR